MNRRTPTTREGWIARLESELPPREDPLARNAAITATYARWYLAEPALFKWAGMAVAASHEAGVYLEVLLRPNAALRRLFSPSFLEAQAEVMRRTNNAVFDDIAWTHLAFLDGRVDAVETALAALPSHGLLLDGFRKIAEGQRLLEREPRRALELVWEGNGRLLEHEQRHTVQPLLEGFHRAFLWFLSAVTRTDFRLRDHRIRQAVMPSFMPYMLRRGRTVLRESGRQLPDIARFDHRWHWLFGEVLPCWRDVEGAGHPALAVRMQELASAGAGSEFSSF